MLAINDQNNRQHLTTRKCLSLLCRQRNIVIFAELQMGALVLLIEI